MNKFFTKILLCILTAIIGLRFIVWHINLVIARGYHFRQIFNWGTWMNKHLLVILGITIFLEIAFLIIFRDKNRKAKKLKSKKEKIDNVETIID